MNLINITPMSKKLTYANKSDNKCNFCLKHSTYWMELTAGKNKLSFRICGCCASKWLAKIDLNDSVLAS